MSRQSQQRRSGSHQQRLRTPALTLAVGLCFGVATAPAHAFDFWGLLGSDEAETTPADTTATTTPLIDEPHAVIDRAYGVALFDYFQQDYFAAITDILVAQAQQQLDANAPHAQLVLGSLYVSYGMLDRGEAIFRELLAEHASPTAAEQAWVQLARIHYKRGNYARAAVILETQIETTPAERDNDTLLLQMLSLLALGQTDAAKALSEHIDSEATTSGLVSFNLGSAYAQLDEMDTAARYYQDLLKKEAASPSPADILLQDRAALALGVYHLNQGNFDEAETVLNQVHLHGEESNRALLALGWARFEADRKLDALTPWLTLAERPISDPAVQESLLNVPFAYESLDALQDALDGYERAYQSFQRQQQALEEIKTRVNAPGWIESISPVDASRHNPHKALSPFKLPVDDPASLLLYPYFASNDFQSAYHDFRELQRLYLVLESWRSKAPDYQKIIEAHSQRLAQAAVAAEAASAQARPLLDSARQYLELLDARFDQILKENDLTGLANPTQLKQLKELAALEVQLKLLNDPETYYAEWDKLRLLQGVLLWDLSEASIAKRWETQKNLLATDRAIGTLEQTIERVSTARARQLDHYNGMSEQATVLMTQVSDLQDSVQTALYHQRLKMQQIASEVITAQQARLGDLRAKALLSIARLQDRAYTESREAAENQDDAAGVFELGQEPTASASESDGEAAVTDTDAATETTEAAPEPTNSIWDVFRKILP